MGQSLLDTSFRRMVVATSFVALASGCGARTAVFEIRARDPHNLLDPARHAAEYREELDYIGARREQLLGTRSDVEDGDQAPSHLMGLAFSGGGIRSATFNLGVLQALNDIDMLDQFDYNSAVSGGGYIAAWQQDHLGAQNLLPRDRYAFEVTADSTDDLLRNHNEHVEQLRTHSGFLNQGGWFEGLSMAGDWLWRWPFHLFLDDIVHLRGWYNFQHIQPIYRSRIEGTYFRGKPPKDKPVRSKANTPLIEVNAPGRESLTPYMILNGNLTNRGESQIGVVYENATKPGHQWNFEFTRDFVGSDATGYIRSAGFGLQVEEVIRDKQGRPTYAGVKLSDEDVSDFTLSRAVAASGAAFDSLSFGSWIDWWGVNETAHLIGSGVLNLNLGLEAPNFAREYDGVASVWDYTRMVTYQRNPRWTDPGARWLYVTDGGLYENLGVLALLRRGVRCVVSIDATADPKGAFGDLHTLRKRVEEDLNLVWVTELPSTADQPVYRFLIDNRHGQRQAVILYVKANANPDLPHLRVYSDAEESAQSKRRLRDIDRTLTTAVEHLLDQLTATAGPAACAKAECAQRERHLIEPIRELISAPGEPGTNIAELQRQERELEEAHSRASAELEDARRRVVESDTALAEKLRQAQQAAPPPEADGLEEERELEAARKREKLVELQDRVDSLKGKLDLVQARINRQTREQSALEQFDTIRDQQVDPRLEALLSALGDAVDRDEWMRRFSLVIDRARSRLTKVASLASKENARARRRERIERVNTFKSLPTSLSWRFPHDSTLVQWYSWERFDAYRSLGYQMTSTYLDVLVPDDDPTLSWCDFPAPISAQENHAER